MGSLAFHLHSGGIGKILTYIATVHNSHLSQTQTLTLNSQTLNFLNSQTLTSLTTLTFLLHRHWPTRTSTSLAHLKLNVTGSCR